MERTEFPEKRHRNIAHLWSDKQIMRFFRKNFDKTHYKNLRSIYLALCEIDSDFGESIEIRNFNKTVATYSGLYKNNVGKYLKALQKADIIDYQRENIEGCFGGTYLQLFKWEKEEEEKKLKILYNELSDKEPDLVKAIHGKSHIWRKPYMVKAGDYKNTKVSKDKNHTEAKNEAKNKILSEKIPYEKIKEFYHSLCPNLPRVRVLSDNRKKTIRARLKQYGGRLHDFEQLFKKAGQSSFLNGDNNRQWKADFDWLLNEANMTKTLEGKYDNKLTQTSSAPAETNGKSYLKLIKDEFKNDDVSVDYFKKNCLVPAKNLFMDVDNVNSSSKEFKVRLTESLLNLRNEIEQTQNKKLSEADRKDITLRCDGILKNYLQWLEDQDWVKNLKNDKNFKNLEFSSPLFRRYREYEAENDNMGRDPISGNTKR